MSGNLGGGGKGYYPAAFEEAKARAAERRLDRDREGSRDADPRARAVGVFFLAAVSVALMSYAMWEIFGPVIGAVAAVVFVVGAILVWRFWR